MKLADKWKRGLPYVGNKGQKAEQIIDLLPPGNRLIDAFGGGGSISLTASAASKWNRIVYNDIRSSVVQLLKELITGNSIDLKKYVCVNRQQFLDWRDKRPDSIERTLVLICYSFGNDMNSYLWSRKNEELKLMMTRALFYGDTGTIYDEMFDKYRGEAGIMETYSWFHKWRRDRMGISSRSDLLQNLQNVQRLQYLAELDQLEQLQQLQQLERLEYSSRDYRDLTIQEDDIVYLDPPYYKSGKQYGGFDHDAFWEWLMECPAKNIYISEYTKLPHTEVAFNLGKKHSFITAGKRKDELLLKVVK